MFNVLKTEETKNGRLVVLLERAAWYGEEFVIGVTNAGEVITEDSYLSLAGKLSLTKSSWTLEEVIEERFKNIVEQAAAGYIFG